MPFQPINFASVPPQGNPGLGNLASNFINAMQAGMKLRNMPAQMQQDMKTKQLANVLQQAQVNKLNKQANLPFGGQIPPGEIGQSVWLDMIGKQYGPNSPQYSNAKRAYESGLTKTKILNDYRIGLTDTQDKRASTTLGKSAQELNDISNGFMPGSGGKIALTPEQQQMLSDQYKLKMQKDTSDSTARQKALLASNLDKTFDQIIPEDLTRYSGPSGAIQLKKEQIQGALGKPSEEFRKYQTALTLATQGAKQARQFYSDSITPQMAAKIEALANPTSWMTDPKIAINNFNTFRNTLKNETGTYRGALKSTDEYEGKNDIKSGKSGMTVLYRNGQPYNIPNEKVSKALKEGGFTQ